MMGTHCNQTPRNPLLTMKLCMLEEGVKHNELVAKEKKR